MLPSPCVRTNMHIYGGVSGGPVFNSKGKVIGINSTSHFGETNLSFVSLIECTKNTCTKNSVIIDGKSDNTIADFIELGLVSAS